MSCCAKRLRGGFQINIEYADETFIVYCAYSSELVNAYVGTYTECFVSRWIPKYDALRTTLLYSCAAQRSR